MNNRQTLVLTDEEQLNIMRKQMELLPTLYEKLAWMDIGFRHDPMFSHANIQIIISELANGAKKICEDKGNG